MHIWNIPQLNCEKNAGSPSTIFENKHFLQFNGLPQRTQNHDIVHNIAVESPPPFTVYTVQHPPVRLSMSCLPYHFEKNIVPQIKSLLEAAISSWASVRRYGTLCPDSGATYPLSIWSQSPWPSYTAYTILCSLIQLVTHDIIRCITKSQIWLIFPDFQWLANWVDSVLSNWVSTLPCPSTKIKRKHVATWSTSFDTVQEWFPSFHAIFPRCSIRNHLGNVIYIASTARLHGTGVYCVVNSDETESWTLDNSLWLSIIYSLSRNIHLKLCTHIHTHIAHIVCNLAYTLHICMCTQ